MTINTNIGLLIARVVKRSFIFRKTEGEITDEKNALDKGRGCRDSRTWPAPAASGACVVFCWPAFRSVW